MVAKNKVQIKKEFEAFAAKVSQLELLRTELHALNTKGFENEVRLIQAKLHDVNALAEVKRDIEVLRRKIDQKAVSHAGETKIHTVLFSTSRELKGETNSLKRRILELEKILEKKKRISVKKQLSSHEVEFVRDIPHLERELKILRETFENHMKVQHMKVDSGVGQLVDTHFDEFLSSIKGELTQKLKEKQMNMNAELKQDLQTREAAFAHRYKELVEEFHEKYRKKVHSELQREVRLHFEQQLRARLEQERKLIVASLIRENIARLADERKHLVHALENDYRRKEQHLKQLLMNKHLKVGSELAEKRRIVEKQLIHLRKQEAELARTKDGLEERARKEHANSLRKAEAMMRQKRIFAERALVLEREKHALEQEYRARAGALQRSIGSQKLVLDRRAKAAHAAQMKRLMKERALLLKRVADHEKELAQLTAKSTSRYKEQVASYKARYAREHARVRKEHALLHKKLGIMKAQERAILKEATLRMQEELQAHVSDNDKEFAKRVEELKSRTRDELQKQIELMKQENEAAVAREVQKKETLIRTRLEQEYEQKLAAAVAKKEEELRLKKNVLEKRMMDHISKAFS